MGKKKSGNPSAKRDAIQAERKARAAESAVGFTSGTCDDVQADAIRCIDELLMQLSLVFPCLQSMGFGSDHLAVSTHCFQHIKYCLGLLGSSASNVAEALGEFWRQDAFPDNLTHKQYLEAAGLQELCKDCLRTIQDAVAMKMLLYPESFQVVMDMEIHFNLKEKLVHAHFIMKRYVRDVAQHLLDMSREHELNGEQEPAVGRPGQAGSSTDAPTILNAPGPSLPQTTPVQDLLEEALVELRPVLDNLSAAGFRAKEEAKYLLNRCMADWRLKAVARAPGGADFSAEVWIRSVAEPQQEQDAWSSRQTWNNSTEDRYNTKRTKDKGKGELQERALLVAILFDVSPILSLLAGGDEKVNSAMYNALKEYVRIQVPSTKQMQDLVLEILQNEPSYYNIAGYSAYVSLLGHLLAGTAVEHEQWAQKTGLFKDPTESLFSSAIHMIVGTAGWWHRSHWHKAESADFVHEVLVALNRIFEGATSLGTAENEICDLATWFIGDYDHVSAAFIEARTLLSLADRRSSPRHNGTYWLLAQQQ
jgi:hypothetical protein